MPYLDKAKRAEASRRWGERHPERKRAANASWYARNRARSRWASLLRSYGITASEYEVYLHRQGGVCAICHGPPRGNSRNGLSLVVDHDHRTGRIRGLLCSVCNRTLGVFQEDSTILRRCIEYLEVANAIETRQG